MSRTRYISNARSGEAGSEIRGDVIYAPISARIGIGGVGQSKDTASDTQRYEIGTRLVSGDGRVFRYGKASASAFSHMKRGVYSSAELVTELASGAVAACAAGATELTVTFAGDFWTKDTLATDELYGGYISLYNSSTIRDQRMIIGNTALTTVGACTIEIDEPIVAAVTSAFNCEVLANPYASLENLGGGNHSILGMPMSLATAGQYFWIQTWGPCRVSPVGVEIGTETRERQLMFSSNGGVISATTTLMSTYAYQYAGFIIEATATAAGSAAPFVMLQISP